MALPQSSETALLDLPALLDVRAVGRLLGCSPRHVYRMADMGQLPQPVNLGRLVRWKKTDLDAFLANDCKPIQPAGRR